MASLTASLHVDVVHSPALTPAARDEVLALCRAAFDEDLGETLAQLGPGVHLLGRVDGRLASHLMIVPRELQPEGQPPLRTGYVELVATHPSVQRRGLASALLHRVPALLASYDIGGLSPSDAGFYARLGWERWTGPLAVRTARGLEATPDEELMILRLSGTPPALDLAQRISVEWRPGEVW